MSAAEPPAAGTAPADTPPGATTPADHMRAAIASLAGTPPAGAPAGPQGVAVTDLQVGELVLLDEVGYEPVDLVSGAGAASWNPQAVSLPGGADEWASAITQALSSARGAIELEAHRAGAHGVVAVRVAMERRPGNVLTCALLGTAIRSRHHTGQRSRDGDRPFGTTLSARDFHLLVRGGYEPAGIAVGAAVVGFPARTVRQGLGLTSENHELQEQTAALYRAREAAMTRLDAEARALRADGVVDVSFGERPFSTMLVHAVEVLALGTAIRRLGGHHPLQPALQLSLDDPLQDVFRHG